MTRELNAIKSLYPTYEEFSASSVPARATERALTIIGEAINRIEKVDQTFDRQQLLQLRAIIAYNFDIMDQPMLWQILETNVPALENEIKALKKKF